MPCTTTPVRFCGLGIVYLALCYLGTLLMRLVLVQVVEAPAARYSFATTFATAMSLFLVVLLHAAAAAAASRTSDNNNNNSSSNFLFSLPRRLLEFVWCGSFGASSSPWLAGSRVADGMGQPQQQRQEMEEKGGTVVPVFRGLLLLLLWQVLALCPATLAFLLAANRLSRHRRRQREAARGQAAARQLAALDGDPYGRSGRRRRGLLSRGPMGVARLLLVIVITAVVLIILLFLLRIARAALNVAPLLQSTVRLAHSLSSLVLQWFAVPLEVPARNVPDEGSKGGPDAAAAIAAAALASVHSPTVRLLYYACEVLVANVGTVGVAIMGLLSGYAAVTSPYNYLISYFYYRKKETMLLQAQQQLTKSQRYALSLCAGKTRRLAQESHESRSRLAPGQEDHLYDRVSSQNERNNKSTGGKGAGWLGGLFTRTRAAVASAASTTKARLGAAVTGGSRTAAKDRQQLRLEAEHAKNLSLFLYLKMDEVGYMLKEARRGSTWVGKVFALCGVLLGLYSTAKFALTVASLYLFHVSTEDPVTRAVSFLESYWVLPPQQQQQQYHNLNVSAAPHRFGGGGGGFSLTAIQMSTQLFLGLALAVNAWMVASSIRGLLLTIFELTLSFTTIVTADTTAVMFAMLMAVYFIGQLVMLRQSLPAPPVYAAAAAPLAKYRGATVQAAPNTAFFAATEGHKTLVRGATVTEAADAFGSSASQFAGRGGPPHQEVNVLFVVLGGLPLYYYQRLHDWCFVIGCVLTAIARKWLLGDPIKATVSVANG